MRRRAPATRRFTLDWASQVQGGPFDKFTGKWHLEGVFVPAPGTTSGAGGTGTTAPGSSPQRGATGTGTSPGVGTSSTVQPQGAGAGAPAGAPSVPGAPPSGDVPAAVPGASSPQAVAAASGPVVQTVTHRSREWKVSAPLAGLAIAVAVIAVGLIIGTRLLERRAGTGRRSA